MLDELAREIREINEANGWNVTKMKDWPSIFEIPVTKYKVPAILALITSELSEALEAFRHRDIDNFLEELADTLIRVLDCAGGFTDDFDAIVRAKLVKNRQRGHRHGGKVV